MNQTQIIGIIVMLAVFAVMMILAYCSNNYSLNGIKNKTVGNGQYGTARWAAKSEIKSAYTQVPFDVENWRKNINLPNVQGTVVGCRTKGKKTVALVDEASVIPSMIALPEWARPHTFYIRIFELPAQAVCLLSAQTQKQTLFEITELSLQSTTATTFPCLI